MQVANLVGGADPSVAFLTILAQFITQLKVNGVASFLIEVAKKSKSPLLNWVSPETPWVTRFLAILAASATAVGIHYQYGNGTLAISGLSVSAVALFLWHVAQNYMFQKAWWKLVFGRMVSFTTKLNEETGTLTSSPAPTPASPSPSSAGAAIKRAALPALLILFITMPFVSGCGKDPYRVAAQLGDDVGKAVDSGSNTVDGMRATGVISPDDERSILSYFSAVNTANGVYLVCVAQVHSSGNAAAGFEACAGTFLATAKSAETLAQFHITDPASQLKVQNAVHGVEIVIQGAETMLAGLK